MTGKYKVETIPSSRGQLQGLPMIRRNVAGIDLGSERHWVCAPTLDGSDREIASFGATTPLTQKVTLVVWPAFDALPNMPQFPLQTLFSICQDKTEDEGMPDLGTLGLAALSVRALD